MKLQSPHISADNSSKQVKNVMKNPKVDITVVVGDTFGDDCTSFKHKGTSSMAGYSD